MKRFLFILMAALMCGPAFGDLVATNAKGDEVRLMHSPCVHGGVLGLLPEALRPKFMKAQAVINGTFFYACWADPGGGSYLILYEDGDARAISVTAFIDQPGV
jgi:hypothetical protein